MLLLVFFIYCAFQLCIAQNSLVDEYVRNITELQQQTLTWTYPENSNSYFKPYFNSSEIYDDGEYDFIICGAGSAGTVLTNRLSEIKKWKILLLEAGSWENDITDVPQMVDNLRTTNYNWGYFTTPQNGTLNGYINNSMNIPRGKGIGGSSIINAMIYARGNKEDFDAWGQNNPGWSYKDVLPYFKKSEKVAFPNASLTYHGTDGTLHVEYSRLYDEFSQTYLDAQLELKRTILDYNAAKQIGASIVQLTEKDGRRDSGGKAFINSIKNRANLRIVTKALITKIIIEKRRQLFVARGVYYVVNGSVHFAKARKEVILTAGSINTAQLLMLSGIGPANHLRDHRIKVLKDLPVGANLWDHAIYSSLSFNCNYSFPNLNLTSQVEQYLNRQGLLTTADYLKCISYNSLFDGTQTVPDTEHVFHAYKSSSSSYEAMKNTLHYSNETYQTVVKPTENINLWSIHSLLLHPKSRGTVRLKTSCAADYPLVNPNYFDDPRDAATLVAAIKDMLRISKTPAMQQWNSLPIKTCHPVCNCTDWGSDEFWTCMVTNLVGSVFHFSGTARMGHVTDVNSVVDNQLRVHGIAKLRVADCSVIPVTTSGHTNAVAFMIGEKAADLIKSTYYTNEPC